MYTGIGIGIAAGLSLFIGYVVGYITTIQKTVKFITFYQEGTIRAVANAYEKGDELQAIIKITQAMKNNAENAETVFENLKQKRK